MGSYETFINCKKCLPRKILCNFRKNPMILIILFDLFFKFINVNPQCFCDDA